MRCTLALLPAILLALAGSPEGRAAQLVLPQQREAYYADEPIELAVAGLAEGAAAAIELVPPDGAALPVKLSVRGDGSTVTLLLRAGTLAPGVYRVRLDGKEAATLTIAGGVSESTCLVSQTIAADKVKQSGGDFILGNAFSFGRLRDGKPLTEDLRRGRSAGLAAFERAVALDLPTIVYMYWTGYVTHKPFGSEKSWASEDMGAAMRLLSFHAAQRLRRYRKNIVCVGTLDEPGLSWGPTPTGGAASGFPNWDERAWYETRGWKYTNDPASRPDADWMKYVRIRCAILGEQNARAARDLKTVWPEVVFSTDLYAPHAIMDGTDPLNQRVNDVPASHVFVDWGLDRPGAYSGIMLEKAHAPTARLAHAMNGQLFGNRVGQPGQLYAYRACLNAMLAAGLASNWWLNTGGMSPADLAAVNTPAKRIGPLLREMTNAEHDVAVLWSFTEIAMRQKEMAAREAARKPDEPINLTVASLPENTAIDGAKEIEINAYNVGQDYKESVQTAHYALARAGYPAHVLHERILPGGALESYKTLVIVGQTFTLPPAVQKALADFMATGGKIVIDRSTTVPFDGAIVAETDLRGLAYRWGALFTQDPKSFKTQREASYFQTNHFMDDAVRRAVAPLKAAMRKTCSVARADTASDELLVERHVGGLGQLYMLLNGFEQLPEMGEGDSYPIYNYAPQQATFALRGLPEECVVYVIEGGDWTRTRKLADPKAEIDGRFEPGEMKLYLVAPREPAGLSLSAKAGGGVISVSAALEGLKMPWPLEVTLQGPAGNTLYCVYRSTGADGRYREEFPIGTNAAPGAYAVGASSPVAGLAAQARVGHRPSVPRPRVLAEQVRVFDARTIEAFLAGKPDVVIAVGSDAHRTAAEKLAAGLAAHGVKATVQPESQVLREVRYPRVWNPYARVYRPGGDEQSLEGKKVERRIMVATSADGSVELASSDGRDFGTEWRQPNSVVTVAGDGLTDYGGDAEQCYAPGVKLYVDEHRRATPINAEMKLERTTPQFKTRWSRPWTRLASHVGAYQLPPQLPEAYTTDHHLILLGDSTGSRGVAALQASELLLELVDNVYPGPGKSLVSFAWSPFAVEKNVILVGATDAAGLEAGVSTLVKLAP